ncbi:MAG: penicillin-binding protein 2 [Phycisphaeraceae bacterium]|nr:MAG: penicillin-binding protein 2 [Phycisphaeraceae bacterium]
MWTGRVLASVWRDRRADRVAWCVAWVGCLGLVVMLGRVVQLQARPPEPLRWAAGTRVGEQSDEAVRGDIMDRRGRLLSATRLGYRVVGDPTKLEPTVLASLKKPVDFDRVVVELSAVTGRSPRAIADDLVSSFRRNEERRAVLARAGEAEAVGAGPEGVPDRGALGPEIASGLGVEPAVAEGEADGGGKVPARLIRYAPLSGVLNDAQVSAFRSRSWEGLWLERVPVREYPGGVSVASLVGKVGVDANGTIGAERALSGVLEGEAGRVVYVRDAAGRPLWIRPGDVSPARHGSDVRLSIDLEIQRIALEELTRGVEESDAAGGRCVVMDPATGEILAMLDVLRPVPDAVAYPFVRVRGGGAGGPERGLPPQPEFVADRRYRVIEEDAGRLRHPALGKNRCVESVYEPGSTFKPFVWALITEAGLRRPEEVVSTENGSWVTSYGREIKDVKGLSQQTWTDVLINSSNIGMGKSAEKMGFGAMREGVLRWGFGRPTGIGLGGEGAGLVQQAGLWKITTQHSVAFGNEVAVTPIQMARAFCAFARSGEMSGTIPPARILAADGEDVRGDVLFRVISPRVAGLTRVALEQVAKNMEASLARRSPGEKEWRYRMFGKSGTSKIAIGKPPEGFRLPRGVRGYYEKQYVSSFIGAGPTERPALVILVTIDDPGPKLTHTNQAYGALTAGPVVRRVMERSLTYLGTPTGGAGPSLGVMSGGVGGAGVRPGPVVGGEGVVEDAVVGAWGESE